MPILSNVKIGYWSRIGSGDDVSDDSYDQSRDVKITDAKQYLIECGLSPSRADDVPPSTAARRAAGTIVGKDPDTGIVLFARAWTRKKDGLLAIKVSEQSEDENGHGVYEDHAEYELTEDGRIKQVNGPQDEYLRIRTAFEHTSTHYRASDLTKIIQNVLQEDGFGAFPCKKNGGVYFIPLRPESLDLLDKLERFCICVGVRFSTYDIPDLASRREEIAEAAARSFTQDLDAHNIAVTNYSAETTKLGVLDNRRDAIDATETMIKNLSGLLNGMAVQLLDRVKELRAMLATKDGEIQKAQEAKKSERTGRRMIKIEDDTSLAPPPRDPISDLADQSIAPLIRDAVAEYDRTMERGANMTPPTIVPAQQPANLFQ